MLTLGRPCTYEGREYRKSLYSLFSAVVNLKLLKKIKSIRKKRTQDNITRSSSQVLQKEGQRKEIL